MTKCIDFLSQPDCLETEGIFRYVPYSPVSVATDFRNGINDNEVLNFLDPVDFCHFLYTLLDLLCSLHVKL
jgi:hypothetical protein